VLSHDLQNLKVLPLQGVWQRRCGAGHSGRHKSPDRLPAGGPGSRRAAGSSSGGAFQPRIGAWKRRRGASRRLTGPTWPDFLPLLASSFATESGCVSSNEITLLSAQAD